MKVVEVMDAAWAFNVHGVGIYYACIHKHAST